MGVVGKVSKRTKEGIKEMELMVGKREKGLCHCDESF